jgi:hypothetical protein
MLFSTRPLAATILALAFSLVAQAQTSVEDQARAVYEKHKSAVVTVQVLIKIKFSGRENENKMDVTGTVLTPEGLTVVSLSATDPTALMKTMMRGGDESFDVSSEVGDVKILLEDNTEIPAQIVLRDAELDLAYVMPLTKPEQPMPFVDFAAAGKPQLLEQIVALTRLGKVANRVHAASFERIEAIVQKPRTFYIAGNDPTQSQQGSPCFTLDGQIAGIFVMRAIGGADTAGSRMFGGNDSVMAILLSAADILEGAQQAPGFADAPAAGAAAE